MWRNEKYGSFFFALLSRRARAPLSPNVPFPLRTHIIATEIVLGEVFSLWQRKLQKHDHGPLLCVVLNKHLTRGSTVLACSASVAGFPASSPCLNSSLDSFQRVLQKNIIILTFLTRGRYCFALLSERWRDPSSDALFPLKKRKGAAQERAKTFTAMLRAKTVKDAASHAREGLRVEGLQRGLAPCGGKENSDPKEVRVSGRFRRVSEKEKGFEGRGLAVGALTPRLKRQTRSSRRLDGSSERTEWATREAVLAPQKGKGSPKGESEWEGESDGEGMSAEKKSGFLQAGPLGSPFVYSGAKKVVPIDSIYARRSPKIAFSTQPETARALKKVGPEWRLGRRVTNRAKGKDAGAIVIDLSCLSEEEALNGTAVEKTAVVASAAKLVAMTAVDTERVVGSLGASEEEARCKGSGGLERGKVAARAIGGVEVAAQAIDGVGPGEGRAVGKSQGERRGQGKDPREAGGRYM